MVVSMSEIRDPFSVGECLDGTELDDAVKQYLPLNTSNSAATAEVPSSIAQGRSLTDMATEASYSEGD
jgi:hypothetical protein